MLSASGYELSACQLGKGYLGRDLSIYTSNESHIFKQDDLYPAQFRHLSCGATTDVTSVPKPRRSSSRNRTKKRRSYKLTAFLKCPQCTTSNSMRAGHLTEAPETESRCLMVVKRSSIEAIALFYLIDNDDKDMRWGSSTSNQLLRQQSTVGRWSRSHSLTNIGMEIPSTLWLPAGPGSMI